MNLTRQIFENLNESEKRVNKRKSLSLKEEKEVKKPYGEAPEEGKAESKETVSTGVKVGKEVKNTSKVKPLENKNKEAGEVYANDTDKYNDNIDDKEHTDKGDIAKENSKKADSTVKVPYGDKVETPSDNKLIKENEELEECGDKEITEGENCEGSECKETLNEGSYSYAGGLLKEIYNQYASDGMEDAFFEDCVNRMDISVDELEKWHNLDECDKQVKECDSTVEECAGSECEDKKEKSE